LSRTANLMNSWAIYLFVGLFAVAQAGGGRYQPVAPKAGSYSWTMAIDGSTKNYIGGRVSYDYISGYTRLESWDSPTPTPGINGISIWDLRGPMATLTFIGPKLECLVQRLPSTDDSVPSADDFSAYKFDSLAYWNRALAEKWVDADRNYLYLDVFTRSLVGMGSGRNVSDPQDQSIDYHVFDWSNKAPDGEEFRLPSTINCILVNASGAGSPPMESKKRIFGIRSKAWHTCDQCVKGSTTALARACGPRATEDGRLAACKQFMPNLEYCSVIMATMCKENTMNPRTMCKQNGSCK